MDKTSLKYFLKKSTFKKSKKTSNSTCAEEDHAVQLKAPEQQQNGPRSKIVLSI